MSSSGVQPFLVDTTSLLAYCKTGYDSFLFENLKMGTSNVCNDEIKRQKDITDDFYKKRACERYLELLRKERNPDVHWVEEYKSNVENQGERTLETMFKNNPDDVKFILLFDFDAIERFQELKEEVGGHALNTRIDLPNYAFERLRRDERMSNNEYCKATYQMGVEEGWMKRHALKFDSVSPITCPQFP